MGGRIAHRHLKTLARMGAGVAHNLAMNADASLPLVSARRDAGRAEP